MNRNALKAKIVEMGMTIEQFCTKAGFSRTTFWRKLRGKAEFDREEMVRISKTLNLSKEEMLNIFFNKIVA